MSKKPFNIYHSESMVAVLNISWNYPFKWCSIKMLDCHRKVRFDSRCREPPFYFNIVNCFLSFLCLSVCLSICLSVCLSVCLTVGHFCLSVCLSAFLSTCPGCHVCLRAVSVVPICPSTCLPVCLPVCLSLSVCLSVFCHFAEVKESTVTDKLLFVCHSQ